MDETPFAFEFDFDFDFDFFELAFDALLLSGAVSGMESVLLPLKSGAVPGASLALVTRGEAALWLLPIAGLLL